MSFLRGILPPNKDLSLVFHCLRKFDIEFYVKPTFVELAPFAEKCITGQERDAKVKEEVEEPFPNLAGDAVPFGEDNDNEMEIKEELVTDVPFALPDRQIPIECHELVSEKGEDAVNDCNPPPISDSESHKKPETKKRNCRSRKPVNYAMEKESEEESDEGQGHKKKPRYNRMDLFDDVEEEEKEDEGMDETVDQDDSVNDEKQCPVDGCTENFSSSEGLVVHMKNHSAPWLCRVCKRSWQGAYHFHRHFLTHTGIRPFKCDVCAKAFTREEHLYVHQRIHTGEKPYACTVCDRRFTQSHSLTVHMRTHTGERPYECDMCEYKTAKVSYLKIHKRIHTGEKPYSCTCGYKTAYSSDLNRHKKSYSH